MNVVYLSDFDFGGSGYCKIGVQVCQSLVEYGHTVKAVGLFYNSQPHEYDFSLFPARDMNEAMGTIQNLHNISPIDVLIVAMDIPFHVRILKDMNTRPFKYVGIAPIESDPLLTTWAMWLNTMDKFYVISEFGAEEAIKAGVSSAEWLKIGINLDLWRVPSSDYKSGVRKAFGLKDDAFVVLTVADNQERKNLSGCLKAFKLFAERCPNSKYILVTKEHSVVGWDLQALAQKMGIADKVMIVDRGMEEASLYGWYCAADCHLLLSKAEGLGLPTLEAMATNLAAIGTDCTATRTLLRNERGFLVPYYVPPDGEPYIDPFGNGYRYMADLNEAAYVLEYLYERRNDPEIQEIKDRGTLYVQSLSTKDSVKGMSDWINENAKTK